jgi:hypothetical protein
VTFIRRLSDFYHSKSREFSKPLYLKKNIETFTHSLYFSKYLLLGRIPFICYNQQEELTEIRVIYPVWKLFFYCSETCLIYRHFTRDSQEV